MDYKHNGEPINIIGNYTTDSPPMMKTSSSRKDRNGRMMPETYFADDAICTDHAKKSKI